MIDDPEEEDDDIDVAGDYQVSTDSDRSDEESVDQSITSTNSVGPENASLPNEPMRNQAARPRPSEGMLCEAHLV